MKTIVLRVWILLLIFGDRGIGAEAAPSGKAAASTVRVAGIVLKWIRGDKEANFRRIEPMIRAAAVRGARIVVTTECFLDGYAIADKKLPPDVYRSLGEPIPEGRYYRQLADLAAELKIHLVAGLHEVEQQSHYNAAVLIGPDGTLVGKYRKQELGHELDRNKPGAASLVFPTVHGQAGVMICADRTRPTIVESFRHNGADFLLCPSGGMFGPKANDPIVQARSRENQRYVIFVHPAEFLVTGPDGSIVQRTILGSQLQIKPEQAGDRDDLKGIYCFDLPMVWRMPYVLPGAPREHVEEIADRNHVHRVSMDGTLDGFNTAQYLDTYAGCKRVEPKFEPNEYMVLENIGRTDVVRPRIVIDGRRNWYSADDILSGLFKPGMNDAERAMTIFAFTASMDVQCHDNNRRVGPPYPEAASHPSRGEFKERADPVKAANCYYCSGCQLAAANFTVLCRHAGLPARAIWLCPQNEYENHCVGETWYDGKWHLFDPECRGFYLDRDNTNVASYEALHKDPALAARTQLDGFAARKGHSYVAEFRQYYPPHVMPVEPWVSRMDMTLRPGERFIWRWDHEGKFRAGNNVRNRGYLPYRLANGKLTYRPPLADEIWQRGLLAANNLAPVQKGGRTRLQPVVADWPAWVIYKVASCYPIVGGLAGGRFARATANDACRVYVSVRDDDWVEVGSVADTGASETYFPTDPVLNARPNPAIYEYYVKYELCPQSSPGAAAIDEVYLETDVQMAATALPALSVGENQVVYRDESAPARRVRITHGWKESSAARPVSAPRRPLAPADGGEAILTAPIVLRWEKPAAAGSDTIVDYHLQVSPRQDMLYPVSPNLDRLLCSAQPEWPLPEGWLVEGRVYYWRVRCLNQWGVWSQWSPVWKFAVR